jgi:hypothetical protein
MYPCARAGASAPPLNANPAALLPQLHAAWTATRIKAVSSRLPGYPRTDGANPSQEKMRAQIRKHGLPKATTQPGFRAKVSPASEPAPRTDEGLPETQRPILAIVLSVLMLPAALTLALGAHACRGKAQAAGPATEVPPAASETGANDDVVVHCG